MILRATRTAPAASFPPSSAVARARRRLIYSCLTLMMAVTALTFWPASWSTSHVVRGEGYASAGVDRTAASVYTAILLVAAAAVCHYGLYLAWLRRDQKRQGERVSQLEVRNAELTEMLRRLRNSRDDIHRQNQELQLLATRDPLTAVLNRRCFYEQLKNLWSAAVRYEHKLACVMLDLDHFKTINDTHGHALGDCVLRDVAYIMTRTVRTSDVICRYGGEEFCILLPRLGLHEAKRAAERLRQAIAGADLPPICVTVSAGVSSTDLSADSPERLLDLADQAMYLAKSRGRNQTAGADELEGHCFRSELLPWQSAERSVWLPETASISFQTVSALMSALAYRDAATADHSRRVADLCMRLAAGRMPMRGSYLLENAALLHDIGKIGVPDSILLKPGPLTEEEWVVMRSHDRIGREIIRSTFNCPELTDIVSTHHAQLNHLAQGHQGEPPGQISLSARMLCIADSYDAMVTDSVYRKGRTHEQACAELRRCAGPQFDPELVEQFIDVLNLGAPRTISETQLVNSHVALRLGQQIESLARALDDKDVASLVELTKKIQVTTASSHLSEINALAEKLNELTRGDAGWLECVQATLDLLECCRDTQRSHLEPTTDRQPA